jgi:hypothetical protein
MNKIKERLANMGVEIPEILLPKEMDLGQWAVVACDQFTQDKVYWKKAGEIAGSPSTLRIILPEVFLKNEDRADRVEEIHRTMQNYLDSGVFSEARQGFVYIERDTPFNQKRRGLVAAVDLEQYDWAPAARPLIRSTEGTVPERLPPRMEIRRNALIETQHILLLIDDDTNTLLPTMGEREKKNSPAYQGKLMLDSGAISGWFLDSDEDWNFLAAGLENLAPRAFTR